MHLLHIESRSIDDTAQAVDLGQSPADIVALSFTDTDLAVFAAAWEAGKQELPTLRLAHLAALRHPYSVDLYAETVLRKARFVLVRLLGGMDYWRYGVDELATLARSSGFHLAIVPGDHREDARLDEASTLPMPALRRIWSYCAAGGPENAGNCLRYIATHFLPNPAFRTVAEAADTPAFGFSDAAARPGDAAGPGVMPAGAFGAPSALIVLYRTWMLAADTDPVAALADALATRGFRVAAVYVTSLKDPAAAVPLAAHLAADRPDVILNLTAFSARLDGGGGVLDRADAPVFQLALSGGSRRQWQQSQRGLGPADLAMNVVLPEFDGRIIAGAISFKDETTRHAALEFTRLVHQPQADGIVYAADLASAWATLARTPRAERRLVCVLSDYPAKAGRTGYAVGLDTYRSIVAIAARLAEAGFAVDPPPDAAALATALSSGETTAALSVADYEALLELRPPRFAESVRAVWGRPADDCAVDDGMFRFRIVRAGRLILAVQPDRGDPASRKTDYHDLLLPPRHGYVAFYLWLRAIERVHAVIHCGTHGTLEWLPGKATALSASCSPRAVFGPMPLIYPFIVNNPGEAAQAKRRVAAVTVGHLTPPLTSAGTHGAVAELEQLLEEYSEAQLLDQRRAARLAELTIIRAEETGLAAESGVPPGADPAVALARLDAWLCDIKDMRIGDGLHVFGCSPDPVRRAAVESLQPAAVWPDNVAEMIAACGDFEMRGLLAALDGRFVPPGPAGAPDRGRLDVLPTGRNLYSVDPRGVPTRTAWEIGQRTAEALLTRYAQDHGDWPKRIVLDIWGSATMRTGGDDLAQAFALLGVRPRWDSGSSRVAGFDILPLAALNRPRVDVTLRISGLFRDVFPAQIALFDDAIQAVAALDETAEDNPLAASDDRKRVFGAAPGAYGIGLKLAAAGWPDRNALGAAYLRATSHAYGAGSDGAAAAPEFSARVAQADVFVHVQDMAGQDVLDADAFAEHEGGFAAAASSLGNYPALYHADTTDPDRSRIRSLREEVARVLRARATNPVWIAGQMRHGYRGAAEIANTVDNFTAFAVLADVAADHQFDLLFDATLGDESVRKFLAEANPAAASATAERFDAAIRRGLWKTRRNSAAAVIQRMLTP